MNDQRKRATPTIDLTATEVPPAPAESDVQAAAESPNSPPAESAAPQGEQSPPPPPEAPPTESSDRPPRRSGGVLTAAVAASFVGAMLAFAVLAALWYGGLLPARTIASNDRSAQIAALQKQIEDLQTRPASASDGAAVDALRQRLGKLESDIAALPPGDKTMAERLAAADSAMKSLGIALAALNKRSDDLAAKAEQAQESAASAEKAVSDLGGRVQSARETASAAADPAALEALKNRVAEIERSIVAAREQITKIADTDKAVRLALSATALREAVEGGAPYRAELAQAKSLGADDKILAPLDSFADSGLPKKMELAQALTRLIPAMMKTVGGEAASSGFLGRLQANASRLVRIEPVDAPRGDKPSDVLARIEVEAAHGDIDGALADIGKLPDAARQPAADWVTKAVARQKALAAVRQFASGAARGLATSPGADAPSKSAQ
jgi:hypothetical protein